MDHLLYRLVLQALYLCQNSSGVKGRMAKGEIQTPNISKVYCKGQGHNSKMILEVRNLFTNKAPFP